MNDRRTPTEQNAHLGIVFNVLLPALEKAGFEYWVYGGVGVAGVAGQFIRRNGDVDIYVREDDFVNVRAVLLSLCKKDPSSKLVDRPALRGRPKCEVSHEGKEVLSVVPVYKVENQVEFRAFTPVVLPVNDAFTREKKRVGDCEFFSPPAIVIATILKSVLTERAALMLSPLERLDDAHAVLSVQERQALKQAIDTRIVKVMNRLFPNVDGGA